MIIVTRTKITHLGTKVTWRRSPSCPGVLHITLETMFGRELALEASPSLGFRGLDKRNGEADNTIVR